MSAACYGSGELTKWSRRTVCGGSQARTWALETAFAPVEPSQIFRGRTRLQGIVTDVATRHKKILSTISLHKTQVIKVSLRRFCKSCLLICFHSLIVSNLRQNAKDSYQFLRTELWYRSTCVYTHTHTSGCSYSYHLEITNLQLSTKTVTIYLTVIVHDFCCIWMHIIIFYIHIFFCMQACWVLPWVNSKNKLIHLPPIYNFLPAPEVSTTLSFNHLTPEQSSSKPCHSHFFCSSCYFSLFFPSFFWSVSL